MLIKAHKESFYYFHNKNESLISKVLKIIFRLLGWKTSIEKDIQKGKINTLAAPPSKSFTKNVRISSCIIEGGKVFTITPNKNNLHKAVIYLHGGAYLYNISKEHWKFIEKLIIKTGATFVIPDYPLAPEFKYSEAHNFMEHFYRKTIQAHKPKDIIFMGDSAGGGLALSFLQEMRNDSSNLPSQLILISPWLDISLSNPEIQLIDKYDTMLGINGLRMAGRLYAGNLDPKNSKVSPLYGKFTNLPKISVFTGTHDILYPDIKILKEKLETECIPLNYFEYPGMMHVWPIIPNLKEADNCIRQISRLIVNPES